MDILCIIAISVFGILMIAWGLSRLNKPTQTLQLQQGMVGIRPGIANELKELAELREKNVITEEEFQKMKEELLDRRIQGTPPQDTNRLFLIIVAIIFTLLAIFFWFLAFQF